MPITEQQLQAIMPHLPAPHAALYIDPLNAAMHEFQITTALPRVQMFLAQIAEESGELRWWHELASGREYEGRADLGNTHPGDGPRFRGRGPIQLTGRTNYRNFGQALGVDLEGNPELAATPEVGFRVAGMYWQHHGCNELADAGDFQGVTRRINGGLNGLADRERYWHRAQKVIR